MKSEELSIAKCGLDRHTCRPDALGKQRRGNVCDLAGPLPIIKRRYDR